MPLTRVSVAGTQTIALEAPPQKRHSGTSISLLCSPAETTRTPPTPAGRAREARVGIVPDGMLAVCPEADTAAESTILSPEDRGPPMIGAARARVSAPGRVPQAHRY